MFDALIFSYMPLMNHNKDYTTDSLLMFYLIVKLFLYCFSLSWFGTFKFLGHLQRKLCVPGTHQEGSVVQYGIYLCLWTMEWIWHPPPSEASIGWKTVVHQMWQGEGQCKIERHEVFPVMVLWSVWNFQWLGACVMILYFIVVFIWFYFSNWL
jgi:hypothetical protein